MLKSDTPVRSEISTGATIVALRKNLLRSFLTLLGVIIGVMTVVAVVSIVSGLLLLPGMLADALDDAARGTAGGALPPLWFYATYRWIGGPGAVPWREAADACFSFSNAEAILHLSRFL